MLNGKFKLKTPFQPAGDQPQAIEKLTSLLQKGNTNQVLLGVTGSGKTFTMANVAANLNRPTLVISHNKTLTAQLATEFQEFFPQNAVHYFVSYYDYYQPEAYIARTDTYVEKETDINEEIDRLRNAATQALLTRRDVLIVASVSCIYGLGNPADYLDLALPLKTGLKIKRDKVLRRLTDLQYQRNDLEIKRGVYRVRGDVLEIIPTSEDFAYRVSFFGDEIESMEVADPLTGKTEYKINEVIIFPAKHFVTTDEKMKAAFDSIKAETEERVKFFEKNGKLIEAQRIRQRTEFDLEMMKETGYVNGIENYSRHIDGRSPGSPPATLIDYFPDDFLLFVDESHMTLPQIRGMHRGDFSRKQALVDYGFRLPSAFDNRPLTFDEFKNKISRAVYVSATPGPYELEITYNETKKRGAPKFAAQTALGEIVKNCDGIAQQVIRPTGLLDPQIEIKPTKNQVDDAVSEIKKRITKGERAIVTTLTKRTAEELAEYLADLHVTPVRNRPAESAATTALGRPASNEIKVHHLHSEIETMERLEILRDLRLGVYDVVVGINLLREGLDLPEVSLVLILDADKEGFLRSETSLVQTMGRAARHINGTVIMYADKVTGSMERAIAETARRRLIQEQYNKAHGITPKSIQKAIKESRLAGAKILEETIEHEVKKNIDVAKLTKPQLAQYMHELTDQMELAAENLEFERAAALRDQINYIKNIGRKKKHSI